MFLFGSTIAIVFGSLFIMALLMGIFLSFIYGIKILLKFIAWLVFVSLLVLLIVFTLDNVWDLHIWWDWLRVV